MLAARCGYFALRREAGMFWLWLWMALTAGVMITSHITKARGDKPSRALLEAIVANLIFGALLARRSL
jgi:hypothetical protein